jgi:hypothetical protein
MRIVIKFRDQPPLFAELNNTETAEKYFNLIRKNYLESKPIFRDSLHYTEKYMNQLATRAKDIFGWNWDEIDDYSSGIGPQLHKDLEKLLVNGFDNIPAEHDELIHELHYCLHLVQHGKKSTTRASWLQIEWYNDDGFELDPTFKFSPELPFGSVKLQNPFVGHGPWQMWTEQDFINISQTCKFHTFVKPGINVAVKHEKSVDLDKLILNFETYDPEFVKLHGREKIIHYTGHPIVGKITNLDDLHTVNQSTSLQLESLEFNE